MSRVSVFFAALLLMCPAVRAQQPQFEVPMRVTDGVATQTLYFGILPTANICIAGDSFNSHLERFLPPIPPGGAFDTRFVSPRASQASTCYDQGSAVDFRPYIAVTQLDTFRVKSQRGAGTILKASWPRNLPSYFTSLTFRYFDGSANVNVDMLADTTVDFTLGGDGAVVNIYSGGLVLPAPVFHASPGAIDFGSVHVFTPKRDSITVRDGGSVAMNITGITSNNPQFTITPSSGTVPALGTMKFYITYTPTAAGTANAKIVFSSNAISVHDTLTVTGTGVQGAFVAQPGSLLFDSVLVTHSSTDSILVRNTGAGSLTISALASGNVSEFGVVEVPPVLISPGDSTHFHIVFHPTSAGVKTGYIRFTHDGSTSPDSVFVSGKGYQTVNVAVPIAAGWDMISNPVTSPVPDDSAHHLFPGIIGGVFSFSNGYNTGYTMVNGTGYWGKFPASTTNTITGSPLPVDSISVTGGWNMVGSISSTVDTGSIVSVPPGLRGSAWFGYSSAYVPATQIVPGNAYWVRSNAAGKFVLANPAARPAKTQGPGHDLTEMLNSLTITDASGKSQTLYFGVDNAEQLPLSSYDLPPVPPAGAFDARFRTQEGGSMVRTHPASGANELDFPVTIQSDAYPLTVAWKMNNGTASYELTGGRELPVKELKGEGSIRITNSSVTGFSVRLVSDGQLPKEFALAQNYPNPFNPATTITYDLPVDSRVLLKVVNLLGQEVVTLIDENQKAGRKSVEWNASHLASGIYFYRLEAGGFTGVKKLVLLK